MNSDKTMLARLVFDESNVSIWQALGPRIFVGVGILVCVAALGFVGYRKARSFRRKADEPETPTADPKEPEIVTAPEPEKGHDPGSLAELASKIHDSTLREFLSDISETVQQAAHPLDESAPLGFVEEIVDRIDDLGTLANNHPEDSILLQEFRTLLVQVLTLCEVEILHSNSWDPATQRAITKEPKSDITEPVILHYGTSGIRRSGQLIRKEEVVLAIPKPN